MGELKKTFAAGLAVLLVLLLAPYYLHWVGYNQEVSVEEEFVDSSTLLDAAIIPEEIIDVRKEPQKKSLAETRISDKNVREFTINTPLYSARVSNFGGGSFTYYSLNNYSGSWKNPGFDDVYTDTLETTLLSDNWAGCAPCVGFSQSEFGSPDVLLERGFDCSITSFNKQNAATDNFNLEDGEVLSLVCSAKIDNIDFVKTTVFEGSSFIVKHDIQVFEDKNQKTLGKISLFWERGVENTEKNLFDDISYSGASVSFNKEIETLSFSPKYLGEKLEASSFVGKIDWAAVRNKYFILAFIPQDDETINGATITAGTHQFTSSALAPVYETSIWKNNARALQVKSYFGPLEIDKINALDTTLDRIMNFGWFVIQPFSRGILWLLKFLHSFGINYGIILILFAFLVRLITGPLTKKSFQSTQKMQAIQPELKKLQEKYKNNSQKLNTEMVKMYREHGVNPMGGCLPMLLQMPLLFSLFMVFRSTIEFRGASFFWWIKDLSLPDTVFNLPFHIPVYGDQVAFLPILLGISMFLTQKMSMANMDGGMGMGQQKYMMYFMSAFFFLLFNSFPSGLNLYYLFYNILNYLQQKSLKKA